MPPPAATAFAPMDPGFEARCRASFGRQKAMDLVGGRLERLEPGLAEVVLPFREDLTQQKGFVHGGIVGMIADSACGYAAYSLMPATSSLVTVEYKINILRPAVGSLLAARTGPAYGEADAFFGGEKVWQNFSDWLAKVPSVNYGIFTNEVDTAVTAHLPDLANGADVDEVLKAVKSLKKEAA